MNRKGLSSIVVLVLIAVLIGGILLYQKQVPLPNTLQTPPSSVAPIADWESYANEEGKFSIKYPPHWKWEIDDSAGDYKRLALTGPEGEVLIDWGSGFGGACPQGFEKVKIKSGVINSCHTILEDGSDNWSLDIPPRADMGYGGFATAKKGNKDLILQILSTLDFRK